MFVLVVPYMTGRMEWFSNDHGQSSKCIFTPKYFLICERDIFHESTAPTLTEKGYNKEIVHLEFQNTAKTLTRDYSLGIIPQFLNPLVVP